MTSVQNDISTSAYDAGRKPFRHNTNRGKWSSPGDFFFASIGYVFGSTHFAFVFYSFYPNIGVLLGLLPLLISMVVYNFPIFFIQSFLGQFSSTGYISVFRIVPILKGMGYVILLVNLISMACGSLLTAIVLLYILNTFRLKLPWMLCNNSYNTESCRSLTSYSNTIFENNDDVNNLSSMQFYKFIIHAFGSYQVAGFSWPVFGCMVIVWGLAFFCLCQNTKGIGKLLRWSCLLMLILFFTVNVRILLLLPIFRPRYRSYSWPNEEVSYVKPILDLSIFSILSLGGGWGNILNLASHNNFKTDIHFWSWTVCGTIFVVNLLSSIFIRIIYMYAKYYLNVTSSWNFKFPMQFVFDFIPLVLGSLELPNMWNFIFFTLLFIGEMSTIVVQLHSAITALCDEFECLREKRFKLQIYLTGLLIILSTFFCFNYQYYIFGISIDKQIMLFLCLLMILLVLWIYGRVRFQRDVQFMIGKTFSNYLIFMVRFITPIIIMLGIFLLLVNKAFLIVDKLDEIKMFSIIYGAIFGIIPINIIIQLFETTGSIGVRWRRLFQVIDWSPADSADRQRYEETLGTYDISHQLVQMVDMQIDLEDIDAYDY